MCVFLYVLQSACICISSRSRASGLMQPDQEPTKPTYYLSPRCMSSRSSGLAGFWLALIASGQAESHLSFAPCGQLAPTALFGSVRFGSVGFKWAEFSVSTASPSRVVSEADARTRSDRIRSDPISTIQRIRAIQAIRFDSIQSDPFKSRSYSSL